ncbi:MAG: hypothetical protein KA385_13795 [Vicinamibacteria bacterium]|nr:hypothetical protein [Vicinamibacteria bacterium]
MTEPTKQDLIAQWAFDTRSLLLRFHLWLEDIEVSWRPGSRAGYEAFDFTPAEIRRSLAMTAAVTALGTRLFARFGEGRDATKQTLNQVKKDADAISAYVTSEALWHFSRKLPENHAIMVCLGEGLMPKAGESPEMGANPLLGFGRVYARPEVAKFIDSRVHRLLNDPSYGWDDFYKKMRDKGITIWGTAIDTLENTSRFAKGEEVGPMTIIHLYDQPLTVTRPYEAYMGTLALPRLVASTARDHSIHLDLLSPRVKVVEAIELAVPGIRRENIHVWTLGGKSREMRLSGLWAEWKALGVHIVEDGWRCPSGLPAFNESGTYAPIYLVGTWRDETDTPHLFLCDGYAASAEAMQAASLSKALDVDVTMALYSPRFERPMQDEQKLMRLNPDAPDFVESLTRLLGETTLSEERVAYYRECLREKTNANLPDTDRVIQADDFFPEKAWRTLAASGYIGDDPYTGLPGVTKLSDDTYAVTTQLATRGSGMVVRFVLRFLAPFEEMRLIFSPLLERFIAGEDYKSRAVKVSDSGRIRNELQTICSQALEYTDDTIRIHFDRIEPDVMPVEKQAVVREVLAWYKKHHPVWFSWLEIA